MLLWLRGLKRAFSVTVVEAEMPRLQKFFQCADFRGIIQVGANKPNGKRERAAASKINEGDTSITVISFDDKDYISPTDMLKAKDGDFFISDWLRNRNTVEFLGVWESIHNPAFNYGEFAAIKAKLALTVTN
jgi:hypothetical protein